MLKRAVREFYRGLVLVHNFRMRNTIVFAKLAKKYDTKTEAAESQKLLDMLYATSLYTNRSIKYLIHQAEVLSCTPD